MSQIRTRSIKTHAKERQDNAKTGEMAEINQDKVPTTSQDQDGDESHFEDLLQKIRSIVKDEISEQVNELRKHITSQMDDLRDNFNRKIADIEESVQFAHSSVAELRTDMNEKVQHSKEELGGLIEALEEKINSLERHSRSYNVRINGVPEMQAENCFNIVADLMEKIGFGDAAAEIENTHRTGKKDPKRPRQIIAKFHSRPFRNRVIYTAKRRRESDSSFKLRIVEDFTKADFKKRKSVIPRMTQAVREGSRATFRNGNLIINGKIVYMYT